MLPGIMPMPAPYVPAADGVGRIPTMTGGTTSGVSMSGTSNFDASLVGWKAGDKNLTSPGNQWMSSINVNGTLNIDLGAAYTIYTYDAANNTYQGGLTTGWTLQGANQSDYSDAVTIDTRSSISWANTNPATAQTFTVASPGAYRYYRFVTTARGGQYSGFAEVQLYS